MHANWREGKEETDDGTERDENGESRWVIDHGDDDGGHEFDEPSGIRAAIDSLTGAVKHRIGSAGPILPSIESELLASTPTNTRAAI